MSGKTLVSVSCRSIKLSGLVLFPRHFLSIRFLQSPHRPVGLHPHLWIRGAPNFSGSIDCGYPDEIVLLAVVNHGQGVSITSPKNMQWNWRIELSKHMQSFLVQSIAQSPQPFPSDDPQTFILKRLWKYLLAHSPGERIRWSQGQCSGRRDRQNLHHIPIRRATV